MFNSEVLSEKLLILSDSFDDIILELNYTSKTEIQKSV